MANDKKHKSVSKPSDDKGFPDIDLTGLRGLRQLVLKDDLTDLFNRRYLTKVLKKERRRADRGKQVFSLMFMDVDNFKNVNDTYGHLTGDKVLVELAGILRASVRDTDVVCRYAGDEFVVLLPNAEEEEATLVAKKIRGNLSQHPWSEKGVPIEGLTISIGLALYPKDGPDLAGLVESADRALYVAKRRGRDLFCSTNEFTPEEEMLRVTLPAPFSQFVGREEEWNRIEELLTRAAEGEGGLVLIGGEAGIGKTRFISELEAKGLLGKFASMAGVCHEETRSIPYFPFREAFAHFLEEKGERLKHYRNLKDAYRTELAKVIPQIGDTPLVEDHLDKYRLFEAVRSLLEDISEETPLFLFLDDLHWVDEASLDLLHYLTRGLSGRRILVCGTYRQEELVEARGEKSRLAKQIDSMSRQGLLQSIDLGCLSEPDTSSMIDSIFPGMSMPQDFKKTVYSKTEGNPFFVEEVLRSLEHGFSHKGFDASQALEVLSGAGVPWSVKGVIERRMQRLDDEDREVLTRAALLGKTFSSDILLPLSGVNEGHLLDVMDSAQKLRLIREDPASEGTRFSFHHSLIAEVLYGGMTGLRKRVLHRRAGEVMEIYYRDRKEDVSEELARHFWEAGSYEKAARHSKTAADRARQVYANDDAIHLYTRALEALGRIEKTRDREQLRFDVLNGRQTVYNVVGQKDSERADLEEMIEVARRLEDHKILSDAYASQSGSYIHTGEYPLAKEFAEKALALKREIGDLGGEGRALTRLGMTLADMGDNEQALESHSQALKTYDQIGDKRGKGRVLFNTGIVWNNLGDYAQALESYGQALSIYREIGDRRMEGATLCNIGVIHSRLGAYEDALKSFTADLEISKKLGDRRGEAAGLHNIGVVTKDSGSYEKALDYCQHALQINRETGDRREEGNCLGDIGDSFCKLGEYQQALAHHQEALRIQKEIGNRDGEGSELVELGNVYGALGEYAKAIDFYQRALSLADETGSKYEIVSSNNSLSRVYRETDGPENFRLALGYAREAADLSSEIGLIHGEILGLSNQGMAYLCVGESVKATECSGKAVSLLEKRRQIEGCEEEIYFNHFRIMRESGDEKEAQNYLKKAHDEVVRKADSIKDERLKDSFLNNVSTNQQIVQEWNLSRRPATKGAE